MYYYYQTVQKIKKLEKTLKTLLELINAGEIAWVQKKAILLFEKLRSVLIFSRNDVWHNYFYTQTGPTKKLKNKLENKKPMFLAIVMTMTPKTVQFRLPLLNENLAQ